MSATIKLKQWTEFKLKVNEEFDFYHSVIVLKKFPTNVKIVLILLYKK